MDKLNHTDLYNAFKEIDPENFNNWKFLSKFIIDRAGLSLSRFVFAGNEHKLLGAWGGVKTRQYPDELGKLMSYIYKNREKINSYMEVGIDHGGTFFLIDSFLRSFKDDYEGSLGIDIEKNKKLLSYFNAYANRYDNCEIRLPSLKEIYDMKIEKTYDLCFIDALHHYDHVERDHNKYAPHSRILAFHDIKLRKTQKCVADYWPEIKTYQSIEFLNEDDRFVVEVGIGVLNP